jgi:NitT/TauT family transport system substrate-binding protein
MLLAPTTTKGEVVEITRSARRGRRYTLLSVPLAFALVAAACGDDDDSASSDTAGAGASDTTAGAGASDTTAAGASDTTAAGGEGEAPPETTEVSLLIPFPSALTFYSLHLADALGYLDEEGIELSITPADGSGAVVQQVAAGNADVGLAGPGPHLSALAQDQPLLSTYVLSTRIPYSLVTLSDSGITTVQDLEGKTVGISEPTGGEALFINALLEMEGVDAEVVEAGGGDTASLALEEGRIDAYSSATSDIIATTEYFEAQGQELTELSLGPFEEFFDVTFIASPEFVEANAEVLTRMERAITKGTIWGIENSTGALAILQGIDPEAVTDCEAARRRLEAQFPNREPTPAMNGMWGYNVPEVWQATADFLFENGEIPSEVDASEAYTNDLIEAVNDFDETEVEADAAAFTEEPTC